MCNIANKFFLLKLCERKIHILHKTETKLDLVNAAWTTALDDRHKMYLYYLFVCVSVPKYSRECNKHDTIYSFKLYSVWPMHVLFICTQSSAFKWKTTNWFMFVVINKNGKWNLWQNCFVFPSRELFDISSTFSLFLSFSHSLSFSLFRSRSCSRMPFFSFVFIDTSWIRVEMDARMQSVRFDYVLCVDRATNWWVWFYHNIYTFAHEHFTKAILTA